MPEWIVGEDDPDLHEVLLAMFELWNIDGVVYKSAGHSGCKLCVCGTAGSGRPLCAPAG